MPDSVGELGEFGLIGAVTARLPQGPDVLLGPGDDSAVVAAPDGRVVVTTDLLVENRHFRRDWSDPADVGHKAAAQNLSDIEAMGARPTSLVVGLGLPADLPASWAVALSAGLGEEAALVGASVVGGDVVRSPLVVVSVTALGTLGGAAPVTRSGARPGDVVAVCGRLGWAEAGYQVLSRGFRTPRLVVEAHRRPQVPYGAGVEAAALGATAMCDVSDGLLGDLGHVADASSVSIDVDPALLEVAAPLREVASALGADPLTWVLTGGDDNALVATFPAGTELPERWTVIGAVAAGSGVTVDGAEYAAPGGHDHFAGP
ncbi:thiamine-phosphate kinase [Jiangella sp. DSM 45060]|uniref:thiamine-phosphate kinase n=1 Tax=Jiangella sp. DSM 45060 TaxID=1798224 RepID=UPI00087AD5B3|nr:thiamine-phosphate kinase [Jiangella sp. DSM 45060]SDS63495.1 thiamine-phosphate kinase [Jiangella sp. DSM 45060]